MNTLSDRLREARINAGFETISLAVKHFKWPYSTYAGHENGHRGAKLRDVEKYAEAFNVTNNWLLTGKTVEVETDKPDKDRSEYGFAEDSIAPFHPSSDTMHRKLTDLAQSMSSAPKRVTFYVLNSHHPSLMLLKGDILIVDQKTTQAVDGTVMVTQLVNETTGAGHTLLRVQNGNTLTPAFGDSGPSPDEAEAAIGSVVCSLRVSPTV